MQLRSFMLFRIVGRFAARLLVILAIAGSASAQLMNSPWPMFRHDTRHTAVSPYHDATPGGVVWKYSAGNGYSSIAIAADGTIYTSGTNNLTALNSNGTLKWTRSIGGSTRSCPAIAADGTVYIGSPDGRLYAINSNGTQKWSFNPSNGQITSSPVIGPDGAVYIGTRGGGLYARNPNNTEKWSKTGLGDMHMTSPAITSDGSTLYVCSSARKLRAINTSNGAEKWSFDTGDTVLSTPALSPDEQTIYFGCSDGYLYAVNTVTHTLRWVFHAGFKQGSTTSSPAVAPDGTIYIGSNYGSIYAVSPTGAELWHFETLDDIRSSPAISADGTIYFATWGGWIYALNPNGTEKWHYLTNAGFFGSPAIAADGTLVAQNTNGVILGNLQGTPHTAVPPTELVATATSETSVRLEWQDNSNDEYGFRIERKTGTTGSYVFVKNVGAGVTSTDDTGLSSGQLYFYRVCAYQEGGYSEYSNEASVTTPGLPAPTDLIATPISGTQIDLSWTDRSSGELGFAIERSVGPNGGFAQVATTSPDTTNYSDVSVNPATNYYYRVRAFDTTRYSSYSNEAWGLTPGKDFTNVVRGDTTRKQMALTFDAGTASIRTGLLDYLKPQGVYCTFFITGLVTELQPTQVARITADGHHIGNHTYDHPDLRDCSDQEIAEQLHVTDTIIRNTTGHHTHSWFRAPYGSTDARVIQTAADAGFRHVFWTVDSGDASWNAGTQEIIDRTLAGASNGCIALYHCTVAATEAAIPTIVTTLRSQGYELVTVPEITAPKQVISPPEAINPGWNLISLPIEPALPFPNIVFRGIEIDGVLHKWDKEAGSLVTYDAFSPATFGNLSPDEGYWLYLSSPAAIKYNGSESTVDRHIKLPQASAVGASAWALIGYPFETPQEFANCSVFNPYAPEPKTVPVAQAMELGWVTPTLYWWDSSTQSLVDLGVPDSFPSSTQIQPWHGYWIQTAVPGLELIVPKPT